MLLFRDFTLNINREIRFSLCKIFGVGLRKAFFVTSRVGLGYPFYLNKMNNYNFTIIVSLLKLFVLTDVRIKRRIEFNIKKFIGLDTVKGLRHKLYLPVHGQRTRTNAGTQRTKRLRYFALMRQQKYLSKKQKRQQKKLDKNFKVNKLKMKGKKK